MTIAIGHVKALHEIDRIARAARVNVTKTHDRSRNAYAVSAESEKAAEAFRQAAQLIGMEDAIS